MKKFYVLLSSLLTILGAQTAMARAADESMCKALLSDPANRAGFQQIPYAPTHIIKADVIPAGGDGSEFETDLPEYCRVEGNIAPTIGFLLRMPTKTWNGKFFMGGCGGACGNYLEDRWDPALVRNYAVVTTDMGHKRSRRMYGYNSIRNLVDDGYRATHVVAVAAKVIIDTYYGDKPKYNYFMGCSTGGRQALTEAQRFPFDFDGIVAGAPTHTQLPWNMLIREWALRNNVGRNGKPRRFITAPHGQTDRRCITANPACPKAAN